MTDLEILLALRSLSPEKQALVIQALQELLLSQRSAPDSPEKDCGSS